MNTHRRVNGRTLYFPFPVIAMTKQNFFAFTIVALLIVGCAPSNRPKDLPELIPCRITLVQDGAPLDGAMLIFYRTDMTETENEWISTAVSDKNGVCQPKVIGKFPGLVAGAYKVIAMKTWMEPRGDLPPDIQDSLPPALEADLVHPKYADKEKTPLEIKVVKKEKNDFSFTLDPPPGGAVIPDPSKWPSTKHRK